MNILAIETSSKIGSLSLRQGAVEINWIGTNEVSRSEDLLPNIEKILVDASLNKSQIDLVAVCDGPGSFTGLRVGISVARSLAFSIGVRCLGVSMPEALALAASRVRSAKAVTALVPLAQQKWCRQEIMINNGSTESQSEIILIDAVELFEEIEIHPEMLFAVDQETYQRFFSGLFENRVTNIISVQQNLATWIGLIAKRKSQSTFEIKAPLPNYLV